ncbi:CAP domain-containing protein [Variovorax sp. OV329]|uniref:CAP domain-containing protein n=1 Tax=Variovorax sp. OV329 TaxID=1882825 RepID=UPI0008E49E0B|nr:CAP domain-containing protein [Variovorax sp. OV329]SFM91736.1 hypothetical protein SAMN05444747_11116 [Variovorax sp. OV329]
MKSNVLIATLATIAALALTACGGGGSSAGNGQTKADTETPTEHPPAAGQVADTSSTLVAVVPATTYTNAEEKAALELLNAERSRCGFGQLAQQVQLDAMARGHANYLLRNNAAGHYQNTSEAFATGNGPGDRALAAGYSYAVIRDANTDTFGTNANVLTERGEQGVRNLLSAPYHALGLVAGSLDVGISVMGSDEAGTTGTYGPRSIVQINSGYQQGFKAQLPDGGAVQTYPCEGTTGTAFELRGESPNPVPGRDLSTNPIGQPIVVQVREGQYLTITSASIKKKGDATEVTLLPVLNKGTDTSGSLDIHQAVIMPATSLLPNTDYIVTLEGTNQTAKADGAGPSGINPAINNNGSGAFSKSFAFRTGS